MANFTTHVGVGTVVSGGLATLTLAADVVAPENLVAVTLAGVLGSVLPDIDLRDSRPSRAMFAGLAILFSFAILFNAATKLSVAELWVLWLGTLVAVRYGLHAIFHRLSVHRGTWHSLLAAVFSSVATAVVYYHVLGRPEAVAWLASAFMMIGFIAHLALDEIYSVDVMDVRVKSSFGTALKFYDRRFAAATFGMLVATAAAIWVAPPTKIFIDEVGSKSLWSGLHRRLLPDDKWFGILTPPRFASGSPSESVPPAPAAADLTTGSIPSEPVAPMPDAPSEVVPIAPEVAR